MEDQNIQSEDQPNKEPHQQGEQYMVPEHQQSQQNQPEQQQPLEINVEQTERIPNQPEQQAQKKQLSPGKIVPENVEQAKQGNEKDEKKKKEEEEKPKEVPFSKLFKYAEGIDIFWMIIGLIAAFGNGISMPLFALIFGEMIDSFKPTSTADEVVDQAWIQAKWFFFLGIGAFFCSWVQMFTWMIAGENQAIRFRRKYLKTIMKQDVSWFDTNNPNALAAKIAQDTHAIGGAIGEKVTTYVQTMSMFFGGFVIAFVKGWELALICTAVIPFLGIATAIFTEMIQTVDINVSKAYSEGSALTEQAINGIKTVKSLNGEKYELKKYLAPLKRAYDTACGYGWKSGAAIGFLWFVMIADYAVGFWFGSIFVGDEVNNALYDRPYTAGDVIAIFFSIMIGGFSIGQATPCIKAFSLGKQAAYRFYEIIDNKTTIAPSLKKGETPSNFEGNIEIKDVDFTYPAKQDVQVLKKINLNIKKGQKTALVGESGCGKSTIMQLIERFYDADKGQVIIDGKDIKDLNLRWLRDKIGYVGQEPVLFATSIKQNMLFAKPDATDEEINTALKQANAYDFIMNLEDKLETFVGTSGSQLSGGQKQRICIARAILKNPQLLLLDEATSALDRTNERSIQKTLDEISKNRTTIVIAHRLSTIQNSDHIIVIDRGEVIDQGTHDELMSRQGKYYALCQNQIQHEKEEDNNDGQQNEINLGQGDNGQQADQIESVKQIQNLEKKESVTEKTYVLKNQSTIKAYQISEEEKKKLEDKMTDEEKAEKAKEQAKKDGEFVNRLKELNKPEGSYMFMGTIFSLIAGTAFPLIAIFMAKMLDIMAKVDVLEDDEYREECNWVGLWFLLVALGSGVSSLFQFASWQRVAEGLTMRLRESCFQKISKMPVAWFDIEENNPGTLASNVATDTQKVNALTSTVVNVQFANISACITGITIGFVYDWRTTLVSIGLFPLFVIAGAIQAQFNVGFSELTDKTYQSSAKIVAESVSNIRTVYSYNFEKQITKTYKELLKEPAKAIVPKGHKSGIAFGFSNICMFIVYGLQFYLAAVFAREYGTSTLDMFTAMFGVLYAAFGAGNNAAFMGDIAAAQVAMRNIFGLLDSEDEIQIHEKTNPNAIKSGEIKGDIEFKDVVFKYPTREKIVLKKINFKIQAGQKIAFVGPSGCGKSTVMQLLLRYYEPLSGEIFVDGKEIHEYDIHFLRTKLGVVNQEPLLFNGTIRENIEYNTENLSEQDIKQAAEQANAKKFIEENDFEEVAADEKDEIKEQKDIGTGYDRQVGLKGGSLSGGQKQRIAIARAIVKKPIVMLLDEATSALDAQNEKIVQESLDKIMQQKTTLAIAHRISTIKDSSTIYVFEDGNIVEQGSYDELTAKQGFFYRLERGEAK